MVAIISMKQQNLRLEPQSHIEKEGPLYSDYVLKVSQEPPNP